LSILNVEKNKGHKNLGLGFFSRLIFRRGKAAVRKLGRPGRLGQETLNGTNKPFLLAFSYHNEGK
jgi:hypothetical protein